MAITINNFPASRILAAYSINGLIFRVNSDAAGLDLKVRGAVYYRKSSLEDWKLLGTKRQSRTFGEVYFSFNFEGFIQAVLTLDQKDSLQTGVFRTKQAIGEFYFVFTEEYRGISGFIEDHFVMSSDIYQVVNLVSGNAETDNAATFVMELGQGLKNFLTDRNRNLVKKGFFNAIILGFMVKGVGSLRAKLIYSGSSQQTVYLNAATEPLDTASIKRYDLVLKDVFANNQSANELIVQIEIFSNGLWEPISEEFYIEHDRQIYRFEEEIFWLNNQSGYDDYIFNARRSKKSKVKKTNYKRERTTSRMSQGVTITDIMSNDEITLWGQFEDTETMAFVQSMFDSPEVFLKESGFLVPIVIETNGIEYDGEGVRQMKIMYTRANNKIIPNG